MGKNWICENDRLTLLLVFNISWYLIHDSTLSTKRKKYWTPILQNSQTSKSFFFLSCHVNISVWLIHDYMTLSEKEKVKIAKRENVQFQAQRIFTATFTSLRLTHSQVSSAVLIS